MLTALVLAVLLIGAAPPPPTLEAVPDEPGTVALPEALTYQAVAADLDGDGARELIRLVAGSRLSAVVEAWTQAGGAWELLGSVDAIPSRPVPGQGDVVYARAPLRLIVRSAAGADRVTLVRQPRFRDVAPDEDCCLLLNDLVVGIGGLTLTPVADPVESVQSIVAVDLDGDATDELVAVRAAEQRGLPATGLVYRFSASRFAAPVATSLVEFQSGPFVVHDSDGLPGDELGAVAAGPDPELVRLRLGSGDRLESDESGLVASDATGVPLPDGRGIAVVTAANGVELRSWPAGGAAGPLLAAFGRPDVALLGVAEVGAAERLLVREGDSTALDVLDLPELAPARFGIPDNPAAAAFAAGPLAPFTGPLPGGGRGGEPTFVHAGRLIPGIGGTHASLAAILPGAEPIGLVGRNRAWLAIQHAPLPAALPSPWGGALEPPILQPGSGVTLAPLTDVLRSTDRDGALDAQVFAEQLPNDDLVVGPGGFVSVAVEAPPGSRVYRAGEGFGIGEVEVVPDTGSVQLLVVPDPALDASNHTFQATVAVTTPAGHGYLGSWEVRVLAQPPALDAAATTALGSVDVTVHGQTDPYAMVTVAGQPVAVADDGSFVASVPAPPWPTRIELTASDPVGNRADAALSGVGLFDYRVLPWIPILVALLGAAAIVLVLRVPQPRPLPRPADDAALEEIDPD